MWNFADIWESIAAAIPTRPALIRGDAEVSWSDFDRKANTLARRLVDLGLQRQSKVAAYLYNGPEYLETYYAAFKAGLAPVNTNYRYVADELIYLFDNADAEAVVFDASFAETVDAIRGKLPKVKAWIAVAEPGRPVPPFAEDYAVITAAAEPRVVAPWGRSGDDLLILYTGGTTGLPKGVMWRLEDLFYVLGGGGNALLGIPPLDRPQDAGPRVTAALGDPASPLAPATTIAAAPLMHGTAQFSSIISLSAGGAVASLPSTRFNAIELWSEAERLRAAGIIIVGMAFAQPMLETLDASPGRWDLSALRRIASSGTVWSMENKQGLLKHLPGCCDPRQPGIVGSGGSRRVGIGRPGDRRDREVHGDAEQRLLHRGRAPGRARLGRARFARGLGLPAARLLQRPREDGANLPHLRRPPMVGSW